MPVFGLKKAFAVGRGVKVFVNLQTGATRGEVPDPWSRRNEGLLRKKNRQIYQLRKQLKERNESLSQQRSPEEVGALPDFVVIGAMRGGTTQFYGLLTRHPNVKRAASKELHYFDDPERFARGLEWYKNCFPTPGQRDGHPTITGEATPRYLLNPLAPGRMAEQVPDARLIALLRNPIDRAYSQYTRWARRGVNVPSFEEAVEAELASIADAEAGPSVQGDRSGTGRGRRRFYQLERGIYAEQLLRWREHFPKEQMLVIKSEDFYERPPEVLARAQDFLGLPRREIKLPPRTTSRASETRYEPMKPETRERLQEFFEPHNGRLYELVGRDFGW